MPLVKDINVYVADNGTVARTTFTHLYEGRWYIGALEFVRPRGTATWKALTPSSEARPGMHHGDASNDMCSTVVTRLRHFINEMHPATHRRPSIKRTPDYLVLTPEVTPPTDFVPAGTVTRKRTMTPTVTRTVTPARHNPPEYACGRHQWCACNGNPDWS